MKFNNITVIGRLGADAVLKTAKSGNEYIQFSAAVNFGSMKENTIWVICRIFRDIGKGINILTKGKLIVMTGQLAIDPNPDSTKPSYHSINVFTFEPISPNEYKQPNDDYDDDALPF